MTMAFEHPSPCIADGASQTLALPKRVDPGAAIAVVLPPAKTADPTRTTPPMAVRWVRLVDGHAHFEGMTNIAPGGAAATGEGLALTVRAPTRSANTRRTSRWPPQPAIRARRTRS